MGLMEKNISNLKIQRAPGRKGSRALQSPMEHSQPSLLSEVRGIQKLDIAGRTKTSPNTHRPYIGSPATSRVIVPFSVLASYP